VSRRKIERGFAWFPLADMRVPINFLGETGARLLARLLNHKRVGDDYLPANADEELIVTAIERYLVRLWIH